MGDVLGIYLAAGGSQRMGQNKLALPWKGRPLGAHGLAAAIQSQLKKIMVVLNPDLDNGWTAPWLDHPKLSAVYCLDASDGQSASVRCGLRAAMECGAKAVMIQLADQPFVSKEILDGLIKSRRTQTSFDYVGYRVNQIIRPPILFNISTFQDLLKLQGDMGARKLIKSGCFKGIELAGKSVSPFIDVDTKEEFLSLPRYE